MTDEATVLKDPITSRAQALATSQRLTETGSRAVTVMASGLPN